MHVWRQGLPVLILAATALTQVWLVKTTGLTAWKGGGFGMFSTTDDAPHRAVRVVVEAPGRSQEVEIAASIDDDAVKAIARMLELTSPPLIPTCHRMAASPAGLAGPVNRLAACRRPL